MKPVNFCVQRAPFDDVMKRLTSLRYRLQLNVNKKSIIWFLHVFSTQIHSIYAVEFNKIKMLFQRIEATTLNTQQRTLTKSSFPAFELLFLKNLQCQFVLKLCQDSKETKSFPVFVAGTCFDVNL